MGHLLHVGRDHGRVQRRLGRVVPYTTGPKLWYPRPSKARSTAKHGVSSNDHLAFWSVPIEQQRHFHRLSARLRRGRQPALQFSGRDVEQRRLGPERQVCPRGTRVGRALQHAEVLLVDFSAVIGVRPHSGSQSASAHPRAARRDRLRVIAGYDRSPLSASTPRLSAGRAARRPSYASVGTRWCKVKGSDRCPQ